MIQSEEINLCVNCPKSIRGICCYHSIYINGFQIILTKHACKYLDLKTKDCTVYDSRREINPNCLTVEEMIILGTVPKECQYVKDNIEYKKRKDLRLYKIPYLELTKKQIREYHKENECPHNEIAIYDIKRSFICPVCQSPDIFENYVIKGNNLQDIEYFYYKCKKCNYKWNNKEDINAI